MDSSLFDRFLDEKNFILAYKRIATNGSMDNIDRVSVEKFSCTWSATSLENPFAASNGIKYTELYIQL